MPALLFVGLDDFVYFCCRLGIVLLSFKGPELSVKSELWRVWDPNGSPSTIISRYLLSSHPPKRSCYEFTLKGPTMPVYPILLGTMEPPLVYVPCFFKACHP